jgi:hypothetical protein
LIYFFLKKESEVLKKTTLQNDYLKGQLLRRGKLLEMQRELFFKELQRLREQVGKILFYFFFVFCCFFLTNLILFIYQYL